jgi:hypothetical protein
MTKSSLPLRPVLLCALAASCAATSGARGKPAETDPRPIAKLVEATNPPAPIGKLLADIDASIRRWNNLLLTARNPEESKKANLLDKDLMRVTHARRADLIEQLESGPLSNRVIAASALGFTRDAEAQSPLIAALDDAHPEVVSNALLGLMVLGRADTPLESICRLMQSSQDEGVRRNAAQCTASLVQGGARAECVLPAARQGLSDPEAGVRSQSALILATLVDAPSLPSLCDRLYDEVPLVTAAAARAVAYIGSQSPTDKGTAARALAKSYADAKGAMRAHLRRALVELAGTDRGIEPEGWAEWARRLP